MELNTDIWGTQSEWSLDTDTFSATNSPYPAYTGKYKYLKDYRAAQTFDFGEEIDNTILYCGQAAGVSPLGGAAAFYYNDNFEGTPEPYIQRNETVSTFLASIGDHQTQHTADAATIASSTLTSILYYKGAVQGADNTRWVIDGGEYITGGDDWYNVADMNAPIVDFDPKCLFGVIYVVAGNENDGVSTMTLHQLEVGNYSNYKIYKAFMRVATVDTVSGSAPYTTSFTETYSSSLTPNKKGLGIIDYTPWEIEGKQYVNYNQNGRSIANYPSIPIFGFDLEVVNLYHYSKFGFSWRSYHYVWNGAERDWAGQFSQAPIFYGATYATFTDVYALKDTSYTDVSFIGYMTNTAENRENIRKMAACYGIYFTEYSRSEDSTLYDSDNRYTNAHMHLGLLREGIGYGDYTTGTGNIDNPAYSWTSSHQSGYDPSAGHDPNTYSNTTVFNPVLDLHSMTKRYVLDGAAVDQLGRDLWKISSDLASLDPMDMFKNYEDLLIDNFLTNDPIKCIVSLDKYPITDIPTGNEKEPIRYGKVTGTAQGRPFDKTSYQFTFQSVSIYPRFGKSFLDYEPYTHYELYIPFCGVAQIDPGDIMGKRLSVIEVLDFSTGAVTAYILANELVINSLTGTCNINIPVTGTDGITLNAQINNGILNMKRSQGNAFLGSILSTFTLGGLIKTGSDPAGAANKFMQGQLDVAQSSYELQHTQVPMHTIGAASAVGSWTIELNCRLLIYYPTGEAITDDVPPSLADLSEYAHTTGFACVLQGKVSDFTGLTVGNIVLDGVNATEEEKKMIQALFSQGVYL